MGDLISFNAFNGVRSRATVQGKGLKRGVFKDDPNGFNRRSLMRRFVMGMGVRAIGRRHPEGEAGVEADIRAALMGAVPVRKAA